MREVKSITMDRQTLPATCEKIGEELADALLPFMHAQFAAIEPTDNQSYILLLHFGSDECKPNGFSILLFDRSKREVDIYLIFVVNRARRNCVAGDLLLASVQSAQQIQASAVNFWFGFPEPDAKRGLERIAQENDFWLDTSPRPLCHPIKWRKLLET